ncbi:MAG: LysM peptidoglycan-binding domain-containing protein [Phycisphaerae bacterium]
MALSVKVALVTCLGFIFGMSCLVSLVARPMVDMPTPLIVRGPVAGARGAAVLLADVDSRLAPSVMAGRFARSSPLETGPKGNRRGGDGLAVGEALPRDTDLASPSLPPLYVPEAPVVVKVDQPAPVPRTAAALVTDLGSSEGIDIEPGARTHAGRAVPAAKKYRVKRGDTLVKIMRRQWNSDDAKLMNVLLAANPKVAKRRDLIFVGEVLIIPELTSSERSPVVAQAAMRAKSTERRGRGETAGQPGVRWYTIRKRDSLASIARRMLNDEGRWREIARLNAMRNVHKILPGMRIKLPPLVNTDI